MTSKKLLLKIWNIKKKEGKGTILIIVVRLPNGKEELIQNFGQDQIQEKMEYYELAYDEDLKLVNNPSVQIIDWLIV